ncbi:hypothetical protein [Bacteriovorax sp. DB6_IX]|uniref:hypothetical protein n=1 Tax=Bacteriovorax sp. DB6_IX TaxID=1353530 RepID=UPI000389DC96|nr:hypothetical protein [Bacteriovorax sp. DB6_IX]EQC48124.1 hypothetical protein M901_0500 [Bacteriovorax sp. DB6_IX]
MKRLILPIFILLCSAELWALEVGECLADPQSKKYINPDFSAPYPKKISFTCRYECQAENQSQILLGKRTVEVRSLKDEARIPVCLGVEVKQTAWGYDFDRVDPFFIYSADMPALKKWAREQAIELDIASSAHLMQKLKENLKQVGQAYEIAGQNSEAFREASMILLDIEQSLPENTEVLDFYITKIEELNKIIPYELNAQNLVMRVLFGSANWRFKN